MKKYLIFLFLLIGFAANAQLKTPSKFVPNGTFPTANATDISGANRVVYDTIMRNAIPYYLRDTLATMVYDITNNCLWRLSGGVANTNWIKISLGTASIDWSVITNKPALFNGDYNSLINKPSYATVATTGSYNDLINKPTIPAAQVNADWNANIGAAQILNKPNDIITGSAAASQLAMFNGTNSLRGLTNILWDSTNKIFSINNGSLSNLVINGNGSASIGRVPKSGTFSQLSPDIDFNSNINAWTTQCNYNATWNNGLGFDGNSGFLRATILPNGQADRFGAGNILTPNTNYTFSFYYKTAGLSDGGIYIVVNNSDGGWTNGTFQLSTVAYAASWTYYTITFNSGAKGTGIFFYKYNNTTSGTFDLDGISLTTSSSVFSPAVNILSNGNIGIGVVSPSQALQVYGNVAPSQPDTFNIGTSIYRYNNVYANYFIKTNGNHSQFLKADGSVDNTNYSTFSGNYNDLSNKPTFPANVSSGNYTPVVNSWSNLDSFRVKECQYIRVGSVVTVSGMIEFYPTVNGTITAGISLPMATGTNYAEKIAGTCASVELPSSYPDVGSVSNEGSYTYNALIKCTNTGGASIKHVMFTFTYTITAAP